MTLEPKLPDDLELRRAIVALDALHGAALTLATLPQQYVQLIEDAMFGLASVARSDHMGRFIAIQSLARGVQLFNEGDDAEEKRTD